MTRMSACGRGCVKTPTPAARVETFLEKLRVLRTDNAAGMRLDAMLENCIFCFSPMYEFSHSLGPSRHLVRCGEMSATGAKADSKSIASFGRC
jgi:hypothetical protein